jgi:hypothetical protein
MAVRVTQVHMSSGGYLHEHIQSVRWSNESTGASGESTTAEMVDYIDNQNGKAYTFDGYTRADIHTVHPANRRPYIQTKADGKLTDNLLALPRY